MAQQPPDDVRRPLDHPHPDYYALGLQAEAEGDWKTAAQYYAQAAQERSAELALINSVQEGLLSKLEMQSIYELVGKKLQETFDVQVVMISQYDAARNRLFHRYAVERGRRLNLSGWRGVDSYRGEIIRTGRPLLINYHEIIRLMNSGRMQIVPGTEPPKTWLGVPMLIGNKVWGVVSLENLDKENAFSPSDVDLLSALTNSMSMSLENARLFNETQRMLDRMEAEMEVARQTQKSILPADVPEQPGWEFGSLIIPARGVGGDFYDFIPLGKDRLCVVLGDVSDKGLPAALFMALIFSLIRTETNRTETGRNSDPEQVLRRVNRSLLRMNASGMYVTLLYGVLDFSTGQLSYSRAGHLPPIVADDQGTCLEIPMGESQPLGLFEEISLDRQEVTIPEGGLALLFSDGLNEASNYRGKEFGLDRVKQKLCETRAESAPDIADKLWQAVKSHGGDIPQDDFTTVVIKRQ